MLKQYYKSRQIEVTLTNNTKVKGMASVSSSGLTITTSDKKPSAHFEHTIVVRKGKAENLSSFEYIEEKING